MSVDPNWKTFGVYTPGISPPQAGQIPAGTVPLTSSYFNQFAAPNFINTNGNITNGGVIGDAVSTTTPQQSATEMLIQQLMAQQNPNFAADARKQASTIFAPQYEMLANQSNRAKTNVGISDKKLAALYKQLVGDTKATGAQAKAEGKRTKAATAADTKKAKADAAAAYAASNSDTEGMANQLGLQAATPAANQGSVNAQAENLSAMDATNQVFQEAANADIASTATFADAQSSAAGMAGAEQRSSLQQALQDRLAAIGDQKQQIASQEASTVANLTGQLTTSYNAQRQAALQALQAQQQQDFTNALATERLNLDKQGLQATIANNEATNAISQQKAATAGQPTTSQQWNMATPLEKGYIKAAELFGSDTNAASNAVNLVMNVGSANSYADAFQFAKAVADANNSNKMGIPQDQLQTLAVALYDSLKGNNSNALLGYLNAQ